MFTLILKQEHLLLHGNSPSAHSYPLGNISLLLTIGYPDLYYHKQLITSYQRDKALSMTTNCPSRKWRFEINAHSYLFTAKKLKSLMVYKRLTAYKHYYQKYRGKANKGRGRKTCSWPEGNQEPKKIWGTSSGKEWSSSNITAERSSILKKVKNEKQKENLKNFNLLCRTLSYHFSPRVSGVKVNINQIFSWKHEE